MMIDPKPFGRFTQKTEQGETYYVEYGISRNTVYKERETAAGKLDLPDRDIFEGSAIDRLAEYEDTGLLPEEILELAREVIRLRGIPQAKEAAHERTR